MLENKRPIKKESRCITDKNEALKDNNWKRSSQSRVTSRVNIKILSCCVAYIQRQSGEVRSVFKVHIPFCVAYVSCRVCIRDGKRDQIDANRHKRTGIIINTLRLLRQCLSAGHAMTRIFAEIHCSLASSLTP